MKQLKITQTITVRSDTLENYLRDISRFPRVSPEEEAELASRVQEGDEEAFERLVKANLRFVVSVAKQYSGNGLDLCDIINEGNVGLVKSIRRFDPSKGFKLISYSVWWIRQSILQAIADQGRMVRLPLNQVAVVSKINREVTKFVQENEREPTAEELAEIMDMDEDKILNARQSSVKHASLDKPLADDDDGGTLMDVVADGEGPRTDAEMDEESLRKDIDIVLQVLPKRDRDIVRSFFGIGCPEQTLDEIGERYDLSRERVRQIKEMAVRKLGRNHACDRLVQYL